MGTSGGVCKESRSLFWPAGSVVGYLAMAESPQEGVRQESRLERGEP